MPGRSEKLKEKRVAARVASRVAAPPAPAAAPLVFGKSLYGAPAASKDLYDSIMSTYTPEQLASIKAREEKAAQDAATNERFGHDMAWLDPEFKQDPALLGQSERSKVFADPALVAAQEQALNQLFGIAKDGGATAQERARRAGARRDSEGWLRGQREADMADLSERGMSGSGAELLALGNDRQAAAQRNSAADLETDAWLEQRAQDAMKAGGELAGQMRDTGFSEGQKRAGAQDEFYALNQQSINSANAANKEFEQQAWNETMRRRNDWDRMKLQLGLITAGGLMSSDVDQGQAGYSYGKGLAEGDANTYNASAGQYNTTINTPNTAATDATRRSQQAGRDALTNASNGFMEWNNILGSMAAGGGMPGGGAGGGGAPASGGGQTWGSPYAGGGTYGSAPKPEDIYGKSG